VLARRFLLPSPWPRLVLLLLLLLFLLRQLLLLVFFLVLLATLVTHARSFSAITVVKASELESYREGDDSVLVRPMSERCRTNDR
jgi:uncharacterized protein (DUF58 family)